MSTLVGRDYSRTTPPRRMMASRRVVDTGVTEAQEAATAGTAASTSIGRVLIAVATCLLLALLLGARGVVHAGMGMTDGPMRTATLAVGGAALRAAEALHVTAPWDRLNAAFGGAPEQTTSPLLASGALPSLPPGPPRRPASAPVTGMSTPVARQASVSTTVPTPAVRQTISAVAPTKLQPSAHHLPPNHPPPPNHPAQAPSAAPVPSATMRATATVVPRTAVVHGVPAPTDVAHREPVSTGVAHRTSTPARPTLSGGRVARTPTRVPLPGPPRSSPPPSRLVTPANPLRLLVTGDSLPGYLGPELVNEATGAGPVRGFVDVHDGTGLTRPDFVDWSLLARRQVAADNPDAVVVWMGGNDFQNMTLPNDQFFQAGTPAWAREYERRAEICMRIWTQGGTRRVYWLSMPPARNPNWAYDDAQINVALRQAAARVPGAEYLNILGPITDHGRYADFITDGQGRPVLVREPDGVHVNIAGSTIVAHEVMAVLQREWRLKQG